MSMQRCKTCKWWQESTYYVYTDMDMISHPRDIDTSEEMVMPFKVLQCNSPNITLFERNPNPDGVSLCDGSDYRAAMYTGEDFGCVNWEERKP